MYCFRKRLSDAHRATRKQAAPSLIPEVPCRLAKRWYVSVRAAQCASMVLLGAGSPWQDKLFCFHLILPCKVAVNRKYHIRIARRTTYSSAATTAMASASFLGRCKVSECSDTGLSPDHRMQASMMDRNTRTSVSNKSHGSRNHISIHATLRHY